MPVTCLAAQARLSRPTLYKIARGGRVPDRKRVSMVLALHGLEARTLAFVRRRQRWEAVRRLPPDRMPPPQDKMMRADEWNEWARCRTCGGSDWLGAFQQGGRALMVCAACVPRSQFSALGLL